MLIDWFTVGAQTLNFVILVWLLKKFLYQPVLDAIDAREARIASQIADARQAEQQATTQRNQFAQQSEQLEHQRAELLAQAASDAQAERVRLIEAARLAAEDLGVKRREALDAEMQQLSRDLGERVGREVFDVARQAMTDLAATSLEARIIEVFLDRLHGLDEAARTRFDQALRESATPVLIRSAWPLPDATRQVLRDALSAGLSEPVDVVFEVAGSLVGGIEAVAGGQKVSWNIAQYLDGMKQAVSELLTPRIAPPPVAPVQGGASVTVQAA